MRAWHVVIDPAGRLIDAAVLLDGAAPEKFLPGMPVKGVVVLRVVRTDRRGRGQSSFSTRLRPRCLAL